MRSGDIKMKNSEAQGIEARHNLKKLLGMLFTPYLNICMGISHRDFNVTNRRLNLVVVVVVVVVGRHGGRRRRRRGRGRRILRESKEMRERSWRNNIIIWLSNNNMRKRVYICCLSTKQMYLLLKLLNKVDGSAYD